MIGGLFRDMETGMTQAKALLQDKGWPVKVELTTERGRILVMDSMGYVDSKCDVSDVLVCGSHSAICAAALAARARPRGVIGHDGGLGKDNAGVSGLEYWQSLGIPGAAVRASSARIGDGQDIWDRGVLSVVNARAYQMGLRVGMPVHAAAKLLLTAPQPQPATECVQWVLEDGEYGKAIGIDTVIYCDDRMEDTLMVMAGHTGAAFARYVESLPFKLRGIVNIDGGDSADGSGVSGMPIFDQNRLPTAACPPKTCRIGDARDVWASGIVSIVNKTAEALGVRPGMTAVEAGRLILEKTQGGRTGI